jgi:thiamine-phosphate pyrophosphorylase
LDANVNRAREGLRVVEDTARFVLDEPRTSRAMRRLRHRLDHLVRAHYRELLIARDVRHDSGRLRRAVSYRGGIADLLRANFKRCGEALRVLEEYGRVLSRGAVRAMQALRFEVYAWEKRLLKGRQ